MHRLTKVLLGSAAALALASGATAFSTTPASAQFTISIPNLGGLGLSYGGGHRARRTKTREHEARHERRSREHEAKDDDDSGSENSANSGHSNKPDRVELSAHAPETSTSSPPPSSNASASSPPPSPPPAQPSTSLPPLTPEQ
jgi:hypothetical protein